MSRALRINSTIVDTIFAVDLILTGGRGALCTGWTMLGSSARGLSSETILICTEKMQKICITEDTKKVGVGGLLG